MNLSNAILWSALVLLSPTLGKGAENSPRSAAAAASANPAAAAAGETLFIGGMGGVYFLAEPGQLVVEVEKRDRNLRGTRSELRAILVGPDRRVLQEASIPDDGQAKGRGLGPVQRCQLSARVEAQAVYALNITVSQDRYGEEVVWGFRSNCRKYLIETARGHKDEAHQEPIVLASPNRSADICFLPRAGAFRIEVTGLPKGAASLPLFDASGAEMGSLSPNADGKASAQFTGKNTPIPMPWRLHLPTAEATVHIDGLTRWETGDRHPNLTLWTPDRTSWFPFLENRWLLTPYSRTVFGQPGERKEIAFRVHNNSDREKIVRLEVEFPEGVWPTSSVVDNRKCVELSAGRITLGPKQTATVQIGATIPASGKTGAARVRATPLDGSGFTTYSTLTLTAGVAPATKPLAMPLLLKPYQHENEQFGYLPDDPVENQVYFDLHNRPFVRTADGIIGRREKSWTAAPFRSAVRERVPEFDGSAFGMPSTKIAFDRDNDLYALATLGRSGALLHSIDGGQTFTAYLIPGRADRPRSFDLEEFSGHNIPDHPPAILRYTQTARDEKLIWRRVHDLELFLPKREAGRLVLGEPVLVSRQCIGLSAHSGIPAAVVSRGTKVHVTWGEATDPKVKVPGVPTYVATYDRETGRFGQPLLVGHGPPANDVHNSPSITMDRPGYLHVLTGTHGLPFPYARSRQTNDAGTGWTESTLTGQDLRQTYIGLVCGPDDTLHAAFRLWRSGVEPFPASSHATLAYQRKRPGQPWEAPRLLIVAPFSEYSVFYHRLTIDRKGRLFLSYDYWSTFWFYRNDHFGSRRALLMSPDGGDTWKLAETSDLPRSADFQSAASKD